MDCGAIATEAAQREHVDGDHQHVPAAVQQRGQQHQADPILLSQRC